MSLGAPKILGSAEQLWELITSEEETDLADQILATCNAECLHEIFSYEFNLARPKELKALFALLCLLEKPLPPDV